MAEPSLAVQAAVYALLKPAIEAEGAKLYDWIPDNAAPPYVAIGDDEIRYPQPDKGDDLIIEMGFDLFAWTKGRSRKSLKVLLNVIHDTLHRADLEVAGWKVQRCEFVAGHTGKTEEKELFLGGQTYRVWLTLDA